MRHGRKGRRHVGAEWERQSADRQGQCSRRRVTAAVAQVLAKSVAAAASAAVAVYILFGDFELQIPITIGIAALGMLGYQYVIAPTQQDGESGSR